MKPIADDQVQLWLVPMTPPFPAALLERYMALLSIEERVRWQRFRLEEDRERFLVARALVRTTLGKLLDSDPVSLPFTLGEYGKPALGTGNLLFNLSHADGLLALAVTRELPVGVDVEHVARKVDMLALARRFFAVSEYEELENLAGEDQRERFFALWTLKEAWVKARGLGLRVPLDEFSFSFAGGAPAVTFSPQLDECAEDWQFRLFRSGAGFRIAVAVQSPALRPLSYRIHEGRPLEEFMPSIMPAA